MLTSASCNCRTFLKSSLSTYDSKYPSLKFAYVYPAINAIQREYVKNADGFTRLFDTIRGARVAAAAIVAS